MAEIIDGNTFDIVKANLEKLQEIYPEAFTEGKVDPQKLLLLLGEDVDSSSEKYSFTWKGKNDCIRLAQTPSKGTLLPCKEESVNWDTTGNLYIEGDNLEVLKLLQKSYLGKIKMIYIDPPYNTGEDFVYEDDFTDNIANYKAVTGQVHKSNAESSGRYHTNWLNMIYPRLRLARMLLSDDGVIFISIDNNEYVNLKKVCDEVFGESNFIDCITWNTRVPKNDNKGLGNIHQYIFVYARNSVIPRQYMMQKDGLEEIYEFVEKLKSKGVPIEEAEKELKKFYNKKGYDRGITLYNSLDENYSLWGKINMSWPNSDTFGPTYDIMHPVTHKPVKKPDRGWRWNEETFNSHLDYDHIIERYDGSYICGDIWFANDENTQPSSVKYLRDVSRMLLRTIVSLKSDGGIELEKIFGGKSFFSNPKPTELMKLLVDSLVEKDGIILDFFSGSATTAHAVMQLNAEDGGNRKFIMVQFPELYEPEKEAYKAGYKTICEVGKERIRRAGKKIKEENPNADLDIGFRVFKLDASNLIKWNNSPTDDPEEVARRIQQSLFYLQDGRKDIDFVYEIMLKLGMPLSANIEITKINDKVVYGIVDNDYSLLICLEHNIDFDLVEKMAETDYEVIIFADRCFGNANMLINTEEILKKKGKTLKLF